MSVQSVTMGYAETCVRSHEFLRRGCSFTPMLYSWAGDLLLTSGALLKQSDVNDMRGAAGEVEHIFAPVEGTDCGGVTAGLPSAEYEVEETEIRTGSSATFQHAIPKAENPEDETNWTLGILQSTDDCGKMMDGGDALQILHDTNRVTSICGTVDRDSGLFAAQAHYLDNRRSYSTDLDNGLLVCIRTGAVWNWEMRYAPVDRDLSEGLSMSDDVSAAFTSALSALGMTHEDVFEFGMI